MAGISSVCPERGARPCLRPLIVSGVKDLESKLELMKSASNAMLSPHRTKEELAGRFLSDRRDAQRNWEVTQVNEFLTQMESFDGIFICTTNLMERLDQASLRKFAFKVKFDYLTKPQRISMFRQKLTRLGG